MFLRGIAGKILNRLKIGWALGFSVMIALSFFSCEDEATQIGLEFKEVLNQVRPEYTDTFSIYSSVETLDSVVTSNASVAILGDFIDPVFGRTRASFMVQYRLSGPWDPGYNAEVDSMKVFFEPGGYYGNELVKQTLNVYELLLDLDPDTTYYSTFDIGNHISEWPIGSTTFLPSDSLIEVTLSKTYARRIIQDTANLNFQSDFIQAFKGFYVNVDPVNTDGAFIQLNLLSTNTYVVIYYHNDTQDNLQFLFYINSYSARINLFEHHYDEAPPETAIRFLNQGTEDSVIYAQGMGSVVSRLEIPGLRSLRDSGDIIINSAQLVFTVSPDDPLGIGLTYPDKIDINIKNEEGQFFNISDLLFSEDYYGGTLDNETMEYRINLTRHIQGYLKGTHDYSTLYLTLPNQVYNPGRVVLTSGKHSKPLKLKLIYTRN